MKEKKKLRILRTITWLPVGGIERRIAMVLPKLKERGHHVELVCLREYGALAEEIKREGINVYLIPLKSRLHPGGLKKLAHHIKEGHFDIIHSHMYRSNVPTTISAKIAGFKGVLLSQVHNIDTWETRRQVLMDRLLSALRDGIIAVSDEVRRDVLETLKISPDKCYVIYNGVDIETFMNANAPEGLREALGVRQEDFVIVMVARLVEQKNHDIVIEALEDIVKENPRIKMLFVGEGKRRTELEEKVREKNLGPHVIFTGKRDDVQNILKIAHVSVLPSFKEGFSNAIVEAMAAGKPVIASDVGGNPEAVIDGKTGFIVSPNDKEKLIACIKKLQDDPDLLKQMGEAAQARARKFSIDIMLDSTETLYLTLLEKKS